MFLEGSSQPKIWNTFAGAGSSPEVGTGSGKTTSGVISLAEQVNRHDPMLADWLLMTRAGSNASGRIGDHWIEGYQRQSPWQRGGVKSTIVKLLEFSRQRISPRINSPCRGVPKKLLRNFEESGIFIR
jgi:hypothetical protein